VLHKTYNLPEVRRPPPVSPGVVDLQENYKTIPTILHSSTHPCVMVPADTTTAHHIPGTILWPLDMLTSFALDPIGVGAPETPGLLGPGLRAVPSGRIGIPSAMLLYMFFRLAAYRDSAVTPPALILRLLFFGPTMISVCPG
jgi:hypothetical protein